MYLIRRTFKIQKGKTRDAAEAAKQVSAKYKGVGQRTPVWIYVSGPTTPEEGQPPWDRCERQPNQKSHEDGRRECSNQPILLGHQ
jgi:hypothetical protein